MNRKHQALLLNESDVQAPETARNLHRQFRDKVTRDRDISALYRSPDDDLAWELLEDLTWRDGCDVCILDRETGEITRLYAESDDFEM